MAKKILLADDSITIQKVIGLTFANEDVQLTVVDNGDEAVMKAKELTPDLIIADVVMPGKDGYEVAYTVKHDPALQHIPVLLLTGTFETFDEAMATKVGADGFITKPFESQALIDKVNELIGAAGKPKAGPSVADLHTPEPVGAGAAAPVDEFADFEPVEEIQPVDLDELAPVEPLEPLDAVEPVADLGLEPVEEIQPVEDPMEGFKHLEPDSSESSFADVSLEEAAPAAVDDFGDHDLPAEPEDWNPPAEAPLAPVAPMAPVAAVAPAPSAPAAGVEDGGWNMGDFNDYQAQSVAASAATEAPAPAAAAPEAPVFEAQAPDVQAPQAPAPEVNYTPIEPVDDFEPIDANEPMAVPEPIDMSAPAPAATTDSWLGEPEPAAMEPAAEPNVEDALFGSGPVDLSPEPTAEPELESLAEAAQRVPVEEPAVPLDQVADMYPLDETPAAPAPADEVVTPFALDSAADAPAPRVVDAMTEPAPEAGDATDMLFAQNSAAEPPVVDHSVAAQARVLPPRMDDFDAPEPAPAPAVTPEVFALDSAAEPPSPAVAAATLAAAPAPAPLTVGFAAPAAPGAVDTSALEAHLASVLNQLADRTGKQVESLIEDAIRKAAPGIIEKLVQKALNDATEKILNETIGRLRNP
jgi:CheY-like chemotaxis protein